MNNMNDTNDKVNYLGEPVEPIPLLRKPEYGTGEIDKRGFPKIKWSLLINADDQGFDKSHKEPNGFWRMTVTLPKKMRLIRYGTEMGHYTAPKGTEYEALSMPYIKESLFFHEYEVVADSTTVVAIFNNCTVDRGIAAPGFDLPGGGVQFFHKDAMRRLIRNGVLREIEQ